MPYLEVIGLTLCKIINNDQSRPRLQWLPLNKHQLTTANDRPGKPDMLSQYARQNQTSYPSMQSADKPIPACIAKVNVYKGLQEPRIADKQKQ